MNFPLNMQFWSASANRIAFLMTSPIGLTALPHQTKFFHTSFCVFILMWLLLRRKNRNFTIGAFSTTILQVWRWMRIVRILDMFQGFDYRKCWLYSMNTKLRVASSKYICFISTGYRSRESTAVGRRFENSYFAFGNRRIETKWRENLDFWCRPPSFSAGKWKVDRSGHFHRLIQEFRERTGK